MYVKSFQTRKPIKICRSVYRKDDLEEIECYAERGGARILKTISTENSARKSIILELDLDKRQF